MKKKVGNSTSMKKLSKLERALASSNGDGDDNDEKSDAFDTSLVWRHALLSCGSNAFGQSSGKDPGNTSDFLMTPVLRPVESMNARLAARDDGTMVESFIKCIDCSSTLSALVFGPAEAEAEAEAEEADEEVVEQHGITSFDSVYVWGSGLSSCSSKIPVQFPHKVRIKELSCGLSHVGVVTVAEGWAYCWGSGEGGMLGHGNRTNMEKPKRIEAVKSKHGKGEKTSPSSQLIFHSISCGAYHSAVVASERAEAVRFVTLPGSRSGEDAVVACGALYTFGQGKAGQLGQLALPATGAMAGLSVYPTLVEGLGLRTEQQEQRDVGKPDVRVVRASCGFHHTLVLTAVTSCDADAYNSTVWAFGYNEAGRLGLGHENQTPCPTRVEFPVPGFQATVVSAGELHSMAAGLEGCYSWGSNSNGQLGCGSNPRDVPQSLVPLRVLLPETMIVRNIGAGSRHSAVLTYCGKLVTWGWGEEGQLGHDSEKSSYIPKPVHLPRQLHSRDVSAAVTGPGAVAVPLALGSAHTMMVVQNKQYVKMERPLQPVEVAPVEVLRPSPAPEPFTESPVPPPPISKSTLLATDDDEVGEEDERMPTPPYARQSIKEIVAEKREEAVAVPDPEPEPEPEVEEEKEKEEEDEEEEGKEVEEEEDEGEGEGGASFFLTTPAATADPTEPAGGFPVAGGSSRLSVIATDADEEGNSPLPFRRTSARQTKDSPKSQQQ